MGVAYVRFSDGGSVAVWASARGCIAGATRLFVFTSIREPDPVVTNLRAEPAWSGGRQPTRFPDGDIWLPVAVSPALLMFRGAAADGW